MSIRLIEETSRSFGGGRWSPLFQEPQASVGALAALRAADNGSHGSILAMQQAARVIAVAGSNAVRVIGGLRARLYCKTDAALERDRKSSFASAAVHSVSKVWLSTENLQVRTFRRSHRVCDLDIRYEGY